MFSHIKSAIDQIVENSSEFILTVNKFTRSSKFSFEKYVYFILLKKGTSNQVDLEDFTEDDLTEDMESISRQAFSQQRININPEIFKEINKQYLNEINYKTNNNLFDDFKGYRVLAGDGSDFEIPDFPKTREEFNVPDDNLNYRNPAMAKFSSIMDVQNGFLLDGIIGDYKQSELELIQENILNIQDLINPEKSILIMDRGYNSTELYALLNSLNTKFIIRLKEDSYKKERKNCGDDSEIKLKLIAQRLNKFKNKELKEEYSEKQFLDLRVVTVDLPEGKSEILLTNILDKEFTVDDFKELYHLRWGIETNYNTLKNRLNIENYSGKGRLTIEQDIYSKFLIYNIVQHYNNYLNQLINSRKRKKGIKQKYKTDIAHLTRKLKKYLPKMILNPKKETIQKYTKKLIKSCTRSPNKYMKKESTERRKQKKRKFNINYRPT